MSALSAFGRTAVHGIGAAAMNVIHPPVARQDGARSVTPGAGQISVDLGRQTACWSKFYAPVLNKNDT
jgi:hypothetical protein